MTDKPRSHDQSKRLFGLCKALFHHWPEQHDFQPENEEHLRAYLLVKAKHRSIKTFHLTDEGQADEFAKLVPIVTAVMMHRYCWAWPEGDTIKVCVPESWSFDKLPHKQACDVMNAIDEYLLSIGINGDEVLKQYERAA